MRTNDTSIFSSSWENKEDVIPYTGSCMAGVKNSRGEVKLVIPYDKLLRSTTKEVIERWIEVGNNTIFPATMEEVYNLNINQNTLYNNVTKNIKKETFYLRPDDKNIKRHDSHVITECTISSIYNMNTFTAKVKKTKDYKDCYKPKINDNWGVGVSDYINKDGINLKDIIKEECAKIIGSEKKSNNCYVITYNADNCFSNHHKLAVLSFYRFLWSNQYDDLVKNTLKIIDLDVNPWDALMLELSRGNYYYYYGLVGNNFKGIPSMDNVIGNFKRNKNINNTFQDSFFGNSTHSFTVINKDIITKAIDIYKQYADIPTTIKCINPTPYLVKDVNYTIIASNASCFQITDKDYNNKWFSRSRFEIIQNKKK